MSGNAPEIAVAYVSIVPEIQGFARQLREQIVGPAGDAGENAGEAAGSGLKDKLKVGAAAAAVAAGAVIAKSIGDALEQANITSKLQAQLGASGKDAAKYGKVAGQLYAKGVTENFEAGAEAIRAVVNGGLVKPDATNKQLESIATKMSDVATTFGTDMSMQTQAVSALMKNGLAKNADEALDVITVGMQKLGPNAEDLLETFQEYPRQLQKLGLDAQTSLGLFSQGLKAGARDTDIIADALKEFSIRSIDMSKGSREAYAALGLNAGQMEQQIAKGGKGAQAGLQLVLDKLRAMKDPVARNAAAVGLFGTQAEDLGSALFKLDPSKAVGAVGAVGGAAKKMGDTIRSGPQYEIQTFTRTLQQNLTNAIGSYLIPALKTTIGYGRSAFAWVKENQAWLLPFAAGIGAIATAIGVYNAVTKTVALVTRGWAIAQGILNTVMALNPFVLVAMLIIGLGAALVVAYKKSETFRNIVQGAFKAVGDAAMWLWNNAIKPAFDFIMRYGRIFATVLALTVFLPITLAVLTAGKLFPWLWKVAIQPAFNAIVGGAKWLWNNGIRPAFGWITGGIKTLAGWAKWLYDRGIKPPLQAIAAVGKWLWDKGLRPAFGWIMDGVKKVGVAFDVARAAIKIAWDKVEGIAKKPIKFVIDHVYNQAIVGVWNKVASAFGAPKLSEFHPKGFATGGYTGAGGKYTPAGIVHKGEYVMPKEATNRIGVGALEYMRQYGQLPGYSIGGLVGDAWDWTKKTVGGAGSAAWEKIKKGASWLKDTLEASARAGVTNVVNPLLNQIPGLDTGWGKAIKGIPTKAVDAIFGYAKEADKKLVPNIDYKPGAGVKQWTPVVLKALSMVGQPAAYLNTTLRRMNQESGGNPRAINNWDINAKNGTPSKGLMQVIDPTFNAYAGKLRPRGIWDPLANIYSSMRYALATYGSLPAAYDRSGGYDSGGWLMPGATLSVNESGKPEPVFTAGQWQVLSTLAARGAEGGSQGGLQAGDRLVLVTDGGSFEAYVDRRTDARIGSQLTGPAALGRSL